MHLWSLIPRSCVLGVAVILAASLLAQSAKEQPVFFGYQTDGMMPVQDPLSLGDASKLEQQLAANPDDETVRDKLLKYYWHNSLREPRLESIFWLIEHHPESPLHGNQTAGIVPVMAEGPTANWFPAGVPLNDATEFERAVVLWKAEVKEHPQDARVLFNAARVVGFSRPDERQIALAERAQQLDRGRYTQPLAGLYAGILLQSGSGALDAGGIKAKLLSSEDSGLIGSVAREMIARTTENLVGGFKGHVPAEVVASEATELLSRAKALDPNNPVWSELMQGAGELASKPKVAPQTGDQRQYETVTIDSEFADMNLLSSPQPLYPPEARGRGVEGTVKFEVIIGADGRVKNVALVSGQSLLVTSAKEAVQQYVYRPIFLDGEAAEVIAPVEVEFHLPGRSSAVKPR